MQVGGQYQLAVLVDGLAPAAVEWSYGVRNASYLTGTGLVRFLPTQTEPYYLSASVLAVNGVSQEAVFILNVTASGQTSSEITVHWANPAPLSAGPNAATIHVSGALPSASIAWTRSLNGVPVSSGDGPNVASFDCQPGIHRLFVTVVDRDGNTAVGDSSISVRSGFGLQSAIVPMQPFQNSLVLLGTVYSPIIEGGQSLATALPFLVAAFEDSVRLIPGTTHFAVDLDPALKQVDDDVIVRTQLGNWVLIGPPTGISTEALPYDYQQGLPVQPAPFDLSAHYGIDVWNVHSAVVGAYKFRVRFRCFRVGDAVFRYTPCEWSGYSGGSGERQRRLLALPTLVDLSLDDETSLNRLSSNAPIQAFSAPEQGFIIGNLSTSGSPDRALYSDDHFYSDQNTATFYESSAGMNDLRVNATYGTPSMRPCVLDFSQPGNPRIVNKPKHLYGRLMLFLAGGAFTTGTVVTVRIYTGAAPGYVDVPITITEDVYNPDYDGFIRAGEASLDIADFEFNRLGVTMDFTVDETHANQAMPVADPEMSAPEPYYYTTVNAPAIRVDDACFRNPQIVPVFEGTFLGSAVPISNCNILACGPTGTYCYVETSGTGTCLALQPLGFPAPFIAPFDDSVHCYGSPSYMGEYLGGNTDAFDAVVGFSGTTGCGVAYQYNPCTPAVEQQLAIVFPKDSVPHPAVSYQDNCYGLVGVVGDTSRLIPVLAADVSPVTGCADIICTGSNSLGGSVDYFDQESLQQVTVAFPHMEGDGVPFFGVAPAVASQGYGATPSGSVKWTVGPNPIAIFQALESATLTFTVLPTNLWRELVLTRDQNRQHYRFYPGLKLAQIEVQPGDLLTLEFGNRTKLYAGQRGSVTWEKHVPLPYLYDSVPFTLPFSTGTILALGFCGINSRQDYSFYGTLGASATMDLPNPDNIVTVKDNSARSEMVLVHTAQLHEMQTPINLPSYQGQQLASPVVFNFYAGRTRAGVHGEMDVWLDTDNPNFPPFLTASDFKSLALIASPYRRITRPGDTSRRGLRVALTDPSDLVHSPRIQVDARGRNISVVTSNDNDYVLQGGILYSFTGNYDYGISDTLYRGLDAG